MLLTRNRSTPFGSKFASSWCRISTSLKQICWRSTPRCSIRASSTSTGVLEVIGFIEETFGITVEDSDLLPENLDSIDGIAQYVIRKKG